VYLPSGGWYDWHSHETIEGCRFVLAPTPMDRIPIYARAGAVVPMWPQAPASTAGHHPTAIELHLFVPLTDGTFTSVLQEDDGLTVAARSGERYRTELELTRRGDQVTLRAVVHGSGYADFAREAFHLVVHGAEPESVQIDGSAVEPVDGRFVLPNAGAAFSLGFGL
jgi:alpha-glucosidase